MAGKRPVFRPDPLTVQVPENPPDRQAVNGPEKPVDRQAAGRTDSSADHHAVQWPDSSADPQAVRRRDQPFVEACARQPVQRLARAKINLALHVTGRRADQYHLLDSLVAFAAVGDLITVEPADTLNLTITGPMGAGLSAGPDNLVLKAALSMGQGRGASITLDKHLPVASGIGGGSADAAATLLALAELWQCRLPGPAAVLALGADLPVCLAGQSARMAGIGDQITPCALPMAHVVLVNPGLALGTAAVFAGLTQRDNPGLPAISVMPDAAALAHYLHHCRNDLEPPALALAPVIAEVIAALSAQTGCLLARMSGSGATCFGLFASACSADRAAAVVAVHRGWWVQSAALAN